MGKSKSSAARAGTFARTQSISAKLAKPNVWAEWLPEKELGPISWAHLAALLLRRLPPERAIEALAPVLDDTRQAVERAFETDIRDDPDAEEGLLPYAGYREAYLESCERDVSTALSKLDGSEDVRWFARQIADRSPYQPVLIWFLLGGIVNALSKGVIDQSRIGEQSSWLCDIAWVRPEDHSALECLIETLFDDFQQRYPSHVEKRFEKDRQSLDIIDPFT